MSEREFNLLYEPWIKVLRSDGTIEEVSLLKVFKSAHLWQGLAGELPTQDVAIMRLLLAILHAVYERSDLDGTLSRLSSPEKALMRWKNLWDRRSFPMEVIEKYLLHYEDRFWLFHKAHPFYQVRELDKATSYNASKLNGELSESNNKIRLFPQRTGDSKEALSYSEAARWLLHINAFDDTSAKPSQSGLPSPGVGWLGKLGIITAVGTNLFETLLLNLIFLKDGRDELWGDGRPIWELKEVKSAERSEITMPNNLASLYTLQSRRLKLISKNKKVTNYILLGGDFFSKENSIAEQMTLWRNAAKKEGAPPEYHPRRHDPSHQLWRDFSVMVGLSDSTRKPGIVGWLGRLKSEGLISQSKFRFKIVSCKYGDKDFFIDDVFSDSIAFNSNLLTKLGEEWVVRIIEEINITEKLSEQVGYLAQDLAKASGNADGLDRRNITKEQAFYRLDVPFRRWLESIDPIKDTDNKEDKCEQWWQQARSIVRELGKEIVNQSGTNAFIGRVVEEKSQGKKIMRRYTAPEAYNRFLYKTSTRKTLFGKERI